MPTTTDRRRAPARGALLTLLAAAAALAAAAPADAARVEGGHGNDLIDGGPGDDVLDGGDGDDWVLGGPGDDTLAGGRRLSSDVIDGGPGRDAILDDWHDGTEDLPPVVVRLDGRPNDGRPDERDNVIGVERIRTALVSTLVAGRAPVHFEVRRSPIGRSRLVGSPGDDRLVGADGDDVIVGGRGTDAILGGGGNDRIEARDGVRDLIDCGPGLRDVAIVDRLDVVDDCERVVVGGRR
ncbi:MAG: hypothetical protein IRZ32_17620 [Solirubrobacteraceae bacterium]|nr:hypothetical protein [Solirubrobacteraceae bacterium]